MATPAKQVVLASGNAGKLREFDQILTPLGFEVRPQSEWDTPEAEETGLTFVENALLKARNAATYTGLPALADDSGLVVPALEGAPGIHSARYSPEGTAAANNTLLLNEMNLLVGEERVAHFYCALVFLRGPRDPAPLVATAAWHGRILFSPRGEGGFGYDPLFFVPEEDCASAELPRERKNRISHRGQAVAALVAALELA
ncbi:MAG: RdgB/HAM1 family non-canonical purine NTP pyrophosphatase [Pseudomonadota bacterium]